jgi:RNA polymerase sigma-70 factor, ECF subfamily
VESQIVEIEVHDLVERAKAGDGEAFGRLYDRYVDQVHGTILRRVRSPELAEDLTSDVFLRALRGLDGFTWQGVDIGAWLMTIARNRCIDHFKSARARLEHPTEEVAEDPIATQPVLDDPEGSALSRDMAACLQHAVGRLNEDHQEILQLRFVHGLSVTESATAMDRTEGAIKALQYRALRALARIIREDPLFADVVPS